MANHRKRPYPPARMVQLLSAAKVELVARGAGPCRSDDPVLTRRAADVDRVRCAIRVQVDAERRPDARDRLRIDLAAVQAEFDGLLRLLPEFAMFERAWDEAWSVMVTERAWPHATEHRRQWRKGMEEAMKPEARACFLGLPTAYQRWHEQLKLVDAGVVDRDVVMGYAVA